MAYSRAESRSLLTVVGLGIVALAIFAGVALGAMQTPESLRFFCDKTGALCGKSEIAERKAADAEIVAPIATAAPSQ